MKYVILDVRWSVDIHGINKQYYVSDFSAILLDGRLHKKDSFCFVNRLEAISKREKIKDLAKGKIFIGNCADGWEQFFAWVPEDAMMVVWGSRDRKIMNLCTKEIEDKRINNPGIKLKMLYSAMTSQIERKGEISLVAALMELELTCLKEQMQDSHYCAKAMVRLFRKMKRVGEKVSGNVFIHWVQDKEYCYVTGKEYFPELLQKKERERKQVIKEYFVGKGKECILTEKEVEVVTERAKWKFSLEGAEMELKYFTNKFYKGLRREKVIWGQGVELEKRLDMIWGKIQEIEKEMEFGVGNQEITDLLERICG